MRTFRLVIACPDRVGIVAKVSNLLADYRSLEHSGADLLRLSPRAQGMAEVIAAFRDRYDLTV